jgi:hypothetical protein
MESHLARNRAIQKSLQKCRDVIRDNTKRERLEVILSELRELEQRMLFKNILHLQAPALKKNILDESQSAMRVKMDQSPADLQLRTKSERKMAKDLQSQRDSARVQSFVFQLLPVIMENPNTTPESIAGLVNNDAEIPEDLKSVIIDELVKRYRQA